MLSKSLNIVFMGTPDFATYALQALIDSRHNICAVYSQPPRPKGRGYKVQKSPVHELAEKHDIPVYTPKTLKNTEAQEEFAAHGADVAIVAAYGLLLPEAVLSAPQFGCLNIHGSLLPYWRGASPIQHAIWKGDKKSGVTIMQMDKGMDTGAMIAKDEIMLGKDMTASLLHDELSQMGAKLVLDVLGQLTSGEKLYVERQDNAQSSYAPLLKKEDGRVLWDQTAIQIDQQVRALNPWPGVWAIDRDAKRFKILEAQAVTEKTSEQKLAGTILNKQGEVVCDDSTMLKITKLQPEGKKAMDFASALNGNYLSVGDVLQ
ncbi:MAG: methionyl-tRNA formyltransferase [Alphaproteobacteria bacterium]|nr:methionyl-tRNA formyltransferase [Alphaproteobacteria bacterium]